MRKPRDKLRTGNGKGHASGDHVEGRVKMSLKITPVQPQPGRDLSSGSGQSRPTMRVDGFLDIRGAVAALRP